MLNKFSYVEDKYNVPSLSQLREMWRLWYSSKLLPNEYFDFELFKEDWVDKVNYIGLIKSKDIWSRYNVGTINDKYINNKWKFYHKFMDLSLPETKLIVTETVNDCVKDIYERSRTDNIFIKPVNGYGGQGCARITKTMTFEAIQSFIFRNYSKGLIYQKALIPHNSLAKFTDSDAIGALRIITLVDEPDTIKIIGAFTKFVGKNNIVDYTSKPGNYLVGVDTTNWSLTTASSNTGLTSNKPFSLNGYPIYGQSIPFGDKIDEEIYRWVSVVHNQLEWDTSLIGWDIAITNEGVYCLEANLKPGFASLQKADGKGYLNVFESSSYLYNDRLTFKPCSENGLTTSWKTR